METFAEHYESMRRTILKCMPGADMELIDQAVCYAKEQHEGQKRKDGSPYIIHPLAVDEMHNLMARCYMVMTDSGGLQEEAPALGKPVLVMRRETERPEAIAAGTAKLAGVEKDEIVRLAGELLDDPAAYARMAKAVNPYGDGHASERIVQAILWHFGRRSERPADFNA